VTLPGRLLAACLLALALAPAAAAQAPQVDPSSPAGTEYQLPVDRAREQASGGPSGGGSTTSASGEAPLFGAGVEPEGDGAGQSHASSKPKTGSGDDAQASGESSAAVVRSYADAPDGGAGALAIGAGAVGVLAIGAAAGLVWRRRGMRG